jgi:rhamnulokinase
MGRYIAVDLGATSGRVALVDTNSGTFDINVVHRFPHEVITNEDGAMRWDWEFILKESLVGIQKAAELGPVTSLAIDSWAVDYGFLDSSGKELLPIRSYRDPRNQVAFEATLAKYGKERIYQTTGIQFLSLNSIYQLMAAKEDPNYVAGAQFLLVPDFLNHALTGVASTEITNASTTQLLDTKSRTWDYQLIELLGLRGDIFPALHEPGSDLGVIRGHGSLDGIKVVATGSHDTASAVAGAPIEEPEIEAYLSSGTWSLLGIESRVPFRGSDAFAINLTNELGVENTVRVLKNITGLWIFEECRRTWREEGFAHDKCLPRAFGTALRAGLWQSNDC